MDIRKMDETAHAQDDLQAKFDEIDRRIEALEERVESCRKAMILARAALLAGGVCLALVLVAQARSYTPVVAITALAAMIGGIVWLGSNRTTRDEAVQELRRLADRKEQLFDEVATRNGWRDLTLARH